MTDDPDGDPILSVAYSDENPNISRLLMHGCPKCGSKELTIADMTIDAQGARGTVICRTCGHKETI